MRKRRVCPSGWLWDGNHASRELDGSLGGQDGERPAHGLPRQVKDSSELRLRDLDADDAAASSVCRSDLLEQHLDSQLRRGLGKDGGAPERLDQARPRATNESEGNLRSALGKGLETSKRDNQKSDGLEGPGAEQISLSFQDRLIAEGAA